MGGEREHIRPRIRTPDQRLRVFVSSTLGELAAERAAARAAIERLRLTPVMFELGARPHPPRELYRSYLDQSHVFVGIYWQSYGWVAPGEEVSGLEDEYRLAGDRPRLLYIKRPAPAREVGLAELIARFQIEDRASYKAFTTPDELASLIENDLALLLSERFESAASRRADGVEAGAAGAVPVPLTATIGRRREVADIADAVRAGRRLITLTGPGGIGKTRLAIEVARLLEREFGDGVHFVPLATVTDAGPALATIADRLGVRVESPTPEQSLTAHLRGRHTLIVLDNLEQIAGIGPALVGLLEGAPSVHVVATSRHALRVGGEWIYAVGTLAVPAGTDPEEVAAAAAVELFVERARAVVPGFALNADSARPVAEIVRRLDGLPLAIELAAAQVRVLSPAALLGRVTASLDALRVSNADLPERQRAVRASLDWSHDLLTAREQALFARLSVFSGGWTLDAAEAVCAAPGEPDVLETLAALLDKSLVLSDVDDVNAEPRFRMLSTVQVYARERLGDRGETEMARRSHLAWCRSLGERAQPYLCGAGQRGWVDRMSPERANVRAAVATALELGDHVAVVELTWDVIVLYFVRDAVDEPDAWLRRVADAAPGLDEVTDAKLRSLFALTRIHHGDYRGVAEALRRAIAVFEANAMDFERAVALHQLGFVQYHLDHDVDGAIDTLRESSSLFAGIGHDWGVSLAEAMLGSVLAACGDLAGAERHHLRSLAYARRIDSDQQIAQALGQIAVVRCLEQRHDEALDLIAQSAPLLHRGGSRADAANALEVLALVAHRRAGERAAATAVCVAAAERARLGVEPWPTLQPFVDRVHGEVRQSLGDGEFEQISRDAAARDIVETLGATLDGLTLAPIRDA